LIVGGTYGMGLFILLLASMAVGWGSLLPWLIVLTAIAGCVFLYEHGLRIELLQEGIARIRRFPMRSRVFIPWQGVETVTANLKTILHMGLTGGVRSEGSDNRLVIRGAGQRIVLHAPLFLAGAEDVSLVLALAQPAAVRRAVEKVRAEGHVNLGSLRLEREGLSLGRRTRVGFKDIRAVSMEFGKVKLETAGGVVRIPIAQVPNAVYLPAILGELTGRQGAPE
jgi:hypothetical protein